MPVRRHPVGDEQLLYLFVNIVFFWFAVLSLFNNHSLITRVFVHCHLCCRDREAS
jgi:hypothetical protein